MARARRILRLAIALLMVAGLVALWQRRSGRRCADDPAPSWAPTGAQGADVTARWLPPIDGACPEGYPVKANDNSGIFHLPGGRFYERTVPERCYTAAEGAEADGYRRAKA